MFLPSRYLTLNTCTHSPAQTTRPRHQNPNPKSQESTSYNSFPVSLYVKRVLLAEPTEVWFLKMHGHKAFLKSYGTCYIEALNLQLILERR